MVSLGRRAAALHRIVTDRHSPGVSARHGAAHARGSARVRRARFGPRVAGLVEQLTEDDHIERFAPSKAALRADAAGDGAEAAAIFAADKLAGARALLAAGEAPSGQKLEHYTRSLLMLERHHPQVPLLADLRLALEDLEKLAP